MAATRLDVYLTEHGYAESRQKAQALIMSGIVYGFAKGMSAELSAAFAAACATITVSSIDTVCKELSAEKAFEIVNKNGVK